MSGVQLVFKDLGLYRGDGRHSPDDEGFSSAGLRAGMLLGGAGVSARRQFRSRKLDRIFEILS